MEPRRCLCHSDRLNGGCTFACSLTCSGSSPSSPFNKFSGTRPTAWLITAVARQYTMTSSNVGLERALCVKVNDTPAPLRGWQCAFSFDSRALLTYRCPCYLPRYEEIRGCNTQEWQGHKARSPGSPISSSSHALVIGAYLLIIVHTSIIDDCSTAQVSLAFTDGN